MKILLTGATGYIAQRLLPVLLSKGHEVICCVRDRARFDSEKYRSPSLSAIEVDFLKPHTLQNIPSDINVAYYLVHSMSTSGGDFEIRFYPSATIATISSNAKTYRDLSGPGFRKLAGYIFGGNETNTRISMTAPVQMDINDSASTMSFVMPSSYNESNLPKPNDTNVVIKSTADEYVAVIRFGGYASDKDLKFYSGKLKNLLKENGITSFGNYRFLGYNPPFQFIGRRNEIIVAVDWKEK